MVTKWDLKIVDDFFLAIEHDNDQFVFKMNHHHSIKFRSTEPDTNGKRTLRISSLSGNPGFLRHLFRRYASKIRQSLSHLSVVPMSQENGVMEFTLRSLDVMLEQLHNNYPQPPLPVLKSLVLTLTLSNTPFQWEQMDSDAILRQMTRLVELAPRSLESWKGAVVPVPGMTPAKVAEVFEHATKIKDICISEKLVAHQVRKDYEYIFHLVSRCPSLKEVAFEKVAIGNTRRELRIISVIRGREIILKELLLCRPRVRHVRPRISPNLNFDLFFDLL